MSTGTLYPDASVAPYRVLNYPPLVLVLVRMGSSIVRPQLAARVLASTGILLALLACYRWMRHRGASRQNALIAVAMSGASFPFLYSMGQFHIEGLASACTIAGLSMLDRNERRDALGAGLLLALGCFMKQTQVVVTLVAIAWTLRARGVAASASFVLSFAAAGIIGSAMITLAFGMQAWRHMLIYTVGTFTLGTLTEQLVSHALSWMVVAFIAFRTAWRHRHSSALSLRLWFLLGTTVWLLASGREGAGYQYFIDWQLALLLWTGQFLHDGERVGFHPRAAGGSLVTLLIAHLVIADVIVGAVLASAIVRGRRLERSLTAICSAIPAAPALTPSESPGLVRACGGIPALHPFIIASLSERGLWDDRAFLNGLRSGAYASLVLPFDPARGPRGVSAERWTSRMIAAMHQGYEVRTMLAPWVVLAPRARSRSPVQFTPPSRHAVPEPASASVSATHH